MGELANDGTIKIGTLLDKSGLQSGMSGLGSFAKSGFSVVGTAAKTAVAAIGGVSTAIGSGIAASIKVGSTFESQMSKVQAISGVTGSELAQLTEKAKEMGAKTKFSAAESAQAMEYMAMAGWKTGDMLAGIGGIMNLAAASGEDLATTSDIVTDALTAMGLQASDAGHFADVLAAASSNSNTNVGLMGETFKYAAPVAGALGYNIEDLSTAIGLMANAGIKGSQAGTALRATLSRLAKPPKEAAEAMEQYGISLTNSDGSMKSLMEVMENMRDSLQGLPADEQAAAAAAIGGQEAMSGLLAIVNASESDFKKLANAIDNADGSAEEMAEIMQNNLSGQLTILRSAAEALGIEIYESIKQPLIDMVKAGQQALNDLTEAFKSGGTQGLVAAGSQIIVKVINGIAQKLPSLITIAIQVIQSITDCLNENLPQIAAAGGALLAALVDGVRQLLPSLASLAMNIVGGIVGALQENAPSLLEQGAQMLTDFIAVIANALPDVVTAGWEITTSLLNGLLSAAPKIIQQASTMLNTWINNILQKLPSVISAGGKVILSLLNGLVNNAPQIIQQAAKLIISYAHTILQNLPAVLQAGIELIGKLLAGIIQAVPKIIAAIPGIVANIGKTFLSYDWLGVGKNIISGIASGVASAAGNLVNAAVGAARNAIDTVKGWLGIHSPSRRARDEIGVQMIAGIGEGIEDETPQLARTSEESIQSSVRAMKKASASDFVATMQVDSMRAASSSEAVLRSQIQAGADRQDDDRDITIVNQFYVDGDKLVEKTVKKTRKQIDREARAARIAKGDVSYA